MLPLKATNQYLTRYFAHCALGGAPSGMGTESVGGPLFSGPRSTVARRTQRTAITRRAV